MVLMARPAMEPKAQPAMALMSPQLSEPLLRPSCVVAPLQAVVVVAAELLVAAAELPASRCLMYLAALKPSQ
jgi:hypothetical protein